MGKPRCGVEDISERTFAPLSDKWPRKHLKWNFHLANDIILKTTRAAFDLWAANSSLTFERDSLNPDILISFREGRHAMLYSRRNEPCSSAFRGPNGDVAHAFFPTGDPNFVSEVHVDKAETWHIQLTKNPPGTYNLLQTLTHEIGHALGLPHTFREDSVMFAFVPEKTFPVQLTLEDVLSIQHLYGAKENVKVPKVITTTTTTTTTIATTTTKDVEMDLCTLRNVDTVLITNGRLYISHERYVWSIDIDGKTYKKPLLLTDYMKFLPKNFTRLTAAYQTPSGNIMLFAGNMSYMITYPRLTLVSTWPRSYTDLGIPDTARKVNAVLNTNEGRTFVIYDDNVVGEIDDCSMNIVKYYHIDMIFPGIPHSVSSAFRYIDGNLYFISKNRFYKFNEFTKTVTASGKFDLGIFGITCPRQGLMMQLRDLLSRFVRIDARETSNRKEKE
ncbi:matrix metalloproteinase-2-like [Temnothorax curvispinosus]|uniref:Matrix metalloproteinase-2-like n=1 Tax=Temnothorax curvispinosus TaxID=300111 RepID=A0A6J1QP68_9HYME|nr:matrix metalloproteinase-2-like [Temnothorax curvispinosus]